MQIISIDQTVRNDTLRDIKDFNCQSLTTQLKNGEQLVFFCQLIKKLLI